MIPPRAPHFGGLWEAGIKSCKTLLRKIVGVQTLTFEELYTVLTQVEAALNSRPISPMSSDPNDLNVLSPGHFLIGSPLDAWPDATDSKNLTLNPQQRWKLMQQLSRSFWTRWQAEYLNNLQHRSKWTKDVPNFQVGDLVLVKEDNNPPLVWPRARITRIFAGNDDVIRVVQLRTAAGTYNRPASKLTLLSSTGN